MQNVRKLSLKLKYCSCFLSLLGKGLKASLILSLIAILSACANSSTGKALEESFKADPILQNNPPTQASPSPLPVPEPVLPVIELPKDFPSEITLYPNATLQTVSPSGENSSEVITTWQTNDPSNAVLSFYEKELKSKDWKINQNNPTENSDSILAEKEDLKVTVALQPNSNVGGTTAFEIRYEPITQTAAASPSPSPSPSPVATTSPSPTPTATSEKPNTNQVPSELNPFVEDVAKLGVFKAPNSQETGTLPDPNGKILRSQYARWLVEVNNKLYANNPSKQIRLAVPSSEPVFTDVPTSHPNFAEIQGLAEAGLIPSSLSGDNTVTKFRPDSSLTREDLIRWKVPLDTRKSLPKASVDAVKERWGFKDTSKIDVAALPAILEDYNNGDNANIRRVFGFTTLFQPKKTVTRAEAAATLWYFGSEGDGTSAKDALTEEKPAQN